MHDAVDHSDSNLRSKAKRYARDSAISIKRGGIEAGLHYLIAQVWDYYLNKILTPNRENLS